MTKKEIIVDHKSKGHVVFTEPTVRQLDILTFYQKMFETNAKLSLAIKSIPNDTELGQTIRSAYPEWEV